jgi:malonyl-CoA O-methyltransferase
VSSPESPFVPVRDGYDRWAEIYDSDGNPLIALEERYFDPLVGPVAGLAVLDLGCGTGRQALRPAAAGADVTAIDVSEGMLARARTKPGAERVRFLVHDAHCELPFEGASFDRVVSGLVLEHIRDLERFLGEMRRVLRPDASAVLSTIHPAMALRGISARFTDPATQSVVHVASAPQSISDLAMAALRAGLAIEHLSEHAPDAELAARFPRAQKYVGWPMLFLMKLRRER